MTPDIATTVYHVIKYGIITGISLSAIILIIGSILVHDTYYIKNDPKFFISEMLIMGILTSLPILYISYLRGGAIKTTIQEFSLLFIKIVLIHLGFQLSGVYSVLFPKSSNLI